MLMVGDILTARRNHEIQQFMDGWDWKRIYTVWQWRLRDFGASAEPLFTELQVHDPRYPTGRKDWLTWCPTNLLEEYHLQLQSHYERRPGSYGPLNVYVQRRGEHKTLRYLWQFRKQPEKIAAVLIAASLFYRVGSTRTSYPETWPPYYCVQHLADLVLAQFGEAKFPWHYRCTQVLPYSSDDGYYAISELGGIVRYTAEEHASLLLRYRPVIVKFRPQHDPRIKRQLLLREPDEIKRGVSPKRDRRLVRMAHPRYGEWPDLSKEELEKLVWSMPTVQVAELFGVSDTAVGKRCRVLGIKKPPRGFWSKVEAGIVPHPNGKRIDL